MIVSKSIGKLTVMMEGTPQEIAEYERLGKAMTSFTQEVHINVGKVNEEEIKKALDGLIAKVNLPTF